MILPRELLELVGHFLDPERGQPLQAQVEDGARLGLGEVVGAVLVDAVARVVDQRDVGRDVGRRPAAGHQPLAGLGRVGGGADRRDHLVDVGDRDREAAEDVGPLARLAELEGGAPGDHLLAEGDEVGEEALRSSARAGRRSAPACCSRSVVCSGVKRKSWFSTTSGVASRRSSTTTRTPKRSLSSWTWAMPSIRFSRASSAIRSIIVALFTW